MLDNFRVEMSVHTLMFDRFQTRHRKTDFRIENVLTAEFIITHVVVDRQL